MKGGIDRDLLGEVLADPVHWLAFGFGAGLVPVAPGTWGSLAGLGLFLLLPPLAWPALLAVVAAVCIAGVWICGESARRLGVHDHGGIVWDEIAGMFIVAACLPATPAWLAAGFLAFRLFDIWKPWPVCVFDRMDSPMGMLMDDVAAGIMSAAAVFAAGRVHGLL